MPRRARVQDGARPAPEPRGLLAVYAARAAASGVDLRPAIAAHRAVGAEGADRAEEPPPVIQGPVRRFGRGTAAHRAAVRRARGGGAAPGIGDWVGMALDGVRGAGAHWRRGRPWRRKVVAGGASVMVVMAGVAGMGLG